MPVVLAAIGDVVDDIVVHVGGPIRVATDTPSSITRRRGGSAANVAAAAARLVGRARFLGQVGDDGTADLVLAELVADGVDVSFVRRAGRTGAIVVLVDGQGERSFLTDPGSARSLDDPDPIWLDGVDVLHVPVYSLVDEPIATTAITTVGWALARGIAVSIDASSVAVLEAYGVERMLALIAALAADGGVRERRRGRAAGHRRPAGRCRHLREARGPRRDGARSRRRLAGRYRALDVGR